MGNEIEKEKQGAYVDFKRRSREMLAKQYDICEEMINRAHKMVMSKKDIRSSKERPGVTVLQAVAERALGEIIRLTPLCGYLPGENFENDVLVVGWNYDPEKEKQLLELKAKIEAQDAEA